MDENVRQRKLRQLLRITLPDGKVLCYKSATMTFVDAFKMIAPERFHDVKLENCHLPLISQEIYPRFKEWMKPIGEGWYVNVQSDSDQLFAAKYLTYMPSRADLRREIEQQKEFFLLQHKGENND